MKGAVCFRGTLTVEFDVPPYPVTISVSMPREDMVMPYNVRKPWMVLQGCLSQVVPDLIQGFSNEKFRNLCDAIPDADFHYFCGIALQEATAFLAFKKSGESIAKWYTLKDEEKLLWKPPDLQDWLKQNQSFHKKLLSYGLESFLHGVRKSNAKECFETLDPESQTAWQKHVTRKAEGANEDIEDSLLAPYPPPKCIQKNTMLSMAELLHGLVAIAKNEFGGCWPEHLAIIDCGSEQRNLRLLLHPRARFLVGLVYTEEHWAVLFMGRECRHAVLFDGLQCPVIQDSAAAFIEGCCKEWWPESGKPQLVLGVAEPQTDNWSCGLRVMISTSLAMNHFSIHSRLLCKLPAGCFDDSDMDDFIASFHGRKEEDSQQQVSGVVKTERGDLPEPLAETARNDASDVPSDLAPPDVPRDLAPPGTPPCVNRPEASRKRERSSTPQAQAGRKKVRAPSKLEQQKAGSKIAGQHGIDHNVAFQKQHVAANDLMPKGHWVNFCISVSQGHRKSLTCKTCLTLYDSIVSPETAVPDEPDVVPEAASLVATEPSDVLIRKTPPRPGRGRPAKDATPFDLRAWLKQHRSEIYIPWPENGAKFPYYCRACKKTIRFFRNHIEFVQRHEDIKTHRRMIGNLLPEGHDLDTPLVPAEVLCLGIPISDSSFPFLVSLGCSFRSMKKTLLTWFLWRQVEMAPLFSEVLRVSMPIASLHLAVLVWRLLAREYGLQRLQGCASRWIFVC